MKKLRFICMILCFAFVFGLSVYPADGGAKAEIPYADSKDPKTSPYWYKTMDVYTEEEAAAAGVPEGYGGYVMKLVDDTSIGITVDFTERGIPVSTVKALHFRVYYTEQQREVRVSIDAGVSWVLRHEAKKPGVWEDVVISDSSSLKQLANADGKLGVFGFGFRCYQDVRNSAVYIDEIRAELFDGDDIPPVISYDGDDHVKTTEGKPFVLNVSAYDEQEKSSFPVEYVWDKQATDGDGSLLKGEYTLTLRAKDSYGNTAEKTLTVTVGERDVTPPVINFGTDSIATVAGAYVRLNVTASDDNDEVTAVQTWSDDALDKKGRLTEGTHTLTLSSSDLSGNKTELTVQVTAK